LCADDGGVLDDLFTYRLGDDVFLTVTNAGNHSADFARMAQIADDEGFNVEVTDEAFSTAMLAVQGPKARQLVESIAAGPLPERMAANSSEIAGHEVLIAGTGYTGEDGVELLMTLDAAIPVWEAVVAAGAVPCGLGARDTLRLEACYHLYGNDLDPSRNPIEAGLGWACKEETGFIGSDAVAAARSGGTPEVLVAFEVTGAGIARTGNPVVGGGVVSSGTFSPTFEKAIGMAYLPAEMAAVGADFQIDVRGKQRTAVVCERPIYRKG
jgi:aminomethyltransferase